LLNMIFNFPQKIIVSPDIAVVKRREEHIKRTLPNTQYMQVNCNGM
jgi:hypothetical protein